MDTSLYDDRIQKAEAKKTELFSQMEETRAEYVSICTTFFIAEFKRLLDHAVVNNPEKTQELGIENLKQLKTELKDLINRVPGIVASHLESPELWAHRQPLPTTRDFMWKSASDRRFESELQLIMGYAGQLILRYGFDQAGPNRLWKETGTELPIYVSSVGPLNQEMQRTLREYKQLFEDYFEADHEIAKRRNEKEQALAKDLWNQA